MVEDEEHFLLHCPTYSSHRCNMLAKVAQKFPSVHGLIDNSQKFVWLLSQEDNDCIIWVSNFIFSSMKKRKKKLDSLLHNVVVN